MAAKDERREFVTGFGGSAGTAVILDDRALLWVDSRYHIQADNVAGLALGRNVAKAAWEKYNQHLTGKY